jgi:hypothetical protein
MHDLPLVHETLFKTLVSGDRAGLSFKDQEVGGPATTLAAEIGFEPSVGPASCTTAMAETSGRTESKRLEITPETPERADLEVPGGRERTGP